MTIQYRSRGSLGNVLITSVHCAICRRFTQTGDYTIAPASSIYAGKPICAGCIDIAPVATGKGVGPTETKVVEPEETK
jgi:hypothetical protein